MQVYRLSFSRWSNGRVALKMLDPDLNTFKPIVFYTSTTGFNTSKPYTPHVFIRNNAQSVPVTLQTSMANTSSGTPTTNTNATYYSTNFAANQVAIDGTNQYVIGALHVPIMSNGKRNRMTASVADLSIVCSCSEIVQLRVIASGGISNPIATTTTVPWSTLQHGTPNAPTYVRNGLIVETVNVVSSAHVQPKQLWLSPGATVYLALVCISNATPTLNISVLVSWNES